MSEYRIIIGLRESIESKVCAAMAEGWECTGGVFYHDYDFMQAMVRYPAYVPKGRELMKGEGNG
jgi:hypothetical protein